MSAALLAFAARLPWGLLAAALAALVALNFHTRAVEAEQRADRAEAEALVAKERQAASDALLADVRQQSANLTEKAAKAARAAREERLQTESRLNAQAKAPLPTTCEAAIEELSAAVREYK